MGLFALQAGLLEGVRQSPVRRGRHGRAQQQPAALRLAIEST